MTSTDGAFSSCTIRAQTLEEAYPQIELRQWQLNLLAVHSSTRNHGSLLFIASGDTIIALQPGIVGRAMQWKALWSKRLAVHTVHAVQCASFNYDRELVLVAVGEGSAPLVAVMRIDLCSQSLEQPESVEYWVAADDPWSISICPARNWVVVGSNAHHAQIFALQSTSAQPHWFDPSARMVAQHNVPSVAVSPCGLFVAMASIDRKCRVFQVAPLSSDEVSESEKFVPVERCQTTASSWGWSVAWVEKRFAWPVYEDFGSLKVRLVGFREFEVGPSVDIDIDRRMDQVISEFGHICDALDGIGTEVFSEEVLEDDDDMDDEEDDQGFVDFNHDSDDLEEGSAQSDEHLDDDEMHQRAPAQDVSVRSTNAETVAYWSHFLRLFEVETCDPSVRQLAHRPWVRRLCATIRGLMPRLETVPSSTVSALTSCCRRVEKGAQKLEEALTRTTAEQETWSRALDPFFLIFGTASTVSLLNASSLVPSFEMSCAPQAMHSMHRHSFVQVSQELVAIASQGFFDITLFRLCVDRRPQSLLPSFFLLPLLQLQLSSQFACFPAGFSLSRSAVSDDLSVVQLHVLTIWSSLILFQCPTECLSSVSLQNINKTSKSFLFRDIIVTLTSYFGCLQSSTDSDQFSVSLVEL